MSMQPGSSPPKRWTRSYPPLALLAIAVLVAVLVLPSSLNLPQSNPTTVLEYAPVPPAGRRAAAAGRREPVVPRTRLEQHRPRPPRRRPPPPPEEGLGDRPIEALRRQPAAPDRGPGVAAVRPVLRGRQLRRDLSGRRRRTRSPCSSTTTQGSYGLTGRSEAHRPAGTYVDIDQPRLPDCPGTSPGPQRIDPKACDHALTRMLKGFRATSTPGSRPTTARSTSGRTSRRRASAAARRGDAVAQLGEAEAVRRDRLRRSFNGFNAEYDEAMAQLGVLSFSSTRARCPERVLPTQRAARLGLLSGRRALGAAVLELRVPEGRAVPGAPVRQPSGSGAPNGEARAFGLWYHDRSLQRPTSSSSRELVKREQLAKCGVNLVDRAHVLAAPATRSTRQDTGTEATQAVALVQLRGRDDRPVHGRRGDPVRERPRTQRATTRRSLSRVTSTSTTTSSGSCRTRTCGRTRWARRSRVRVEPSGGLARATARTRRATRRR